jgi:hypothetical protein
MTKKLLLLAALCLSFIFPDAQPKFVNGFTVNMAGDTSRGFILQESNVQLARGITFKTDINSKESKTFSPEDLQSFGFRDGNLYYSIEYTDTRDSSIRKKEFAKLLVGGYYNLYAIAREKANFYWLKSAGDSGYFMYGDEIDYLYLRNLPGNYKNTFNFLARDCDKITARLERLVYSDQSISHFVKDLNHCVSPATQVIEAKKAKWEKHFQVYAGGIILGTHRSQTTFQAFLKLINPETGRKFSMYAGISYVNFNDRSFDYIYGPGKVFKDFNSKLFSIPIIFQYNFTKGIIQPYVNGGVSLANLKENTVQTYHNSFGEIFTNSFQNNRTGVAILMAAGIEVFPISNLIIKAEWKYELYFQYPVAGIAYQF